MRWSGIVAAALLAGLTGRGAAAADETVVCLTPAERGASVDKSFDLRRIEACTHALEAATTDADRTKLLFARSETYYRTHSAALSLIDLHKIDDMGTNAAYVTYDRAVNYAGLGLYALALDQAEIAIRSGVRVPGIYTLRGGAKSFLGRYGDAIEDLDLAISEDPNASLAFERRGFAELEIGELDRAIPDLTRAIALEPSLAEAFYYRGRAHYALDQFDEAIADFRAADMLKPDETAAREEIDEVTALMNSPVPPDGPVANGPSRGVGRSHNCGAYYPFLTGRLLQGGDAMIHYDVSETGAISGVGLERSSGIEALDRAAVICVSRHWRNTPAYRDGAPVATSHHLALIRFVPHATTPTELWRGKTLAAIGRYDEAVAEYSRVIGVDPSNSEAYYRRGLVHFVERDYPAATSDFDKAAKLKPNDSEAAAARDLVKATMLSGLHGRQGI